MTLRCVLDGLLLPAVVRPGETVVAYDGDESFPMEAVEAVFYELVAATWEELLGLQKLRFRLLRHAPDFRLQR